MVPTLEVGQRVLVNRISYALQRPERRRHRRLPPAARAPSGNECGGGHAARRPGLRPADAEQRADVNFIKRVVAGPGDTDRASATGTSIVNGKRQKEPFIAALRRRRGMRLPARRSRFRRSLFHDGRQPWGSPTTAGSGDPSPRSGSSAGLRHLLAAQAHRAPLKRAGREAARQARRTAARGCSGSTAGSAAASSRAPTRPGAAASPARSSPPRCCSTTSG